MNKEDRPEAKSQYEKFLRMDRIPHIWCPGCGIGTVVTSFNEALKKSKIDLDSVSVVSGIGCTGRVAGYVKLDSFHTTHGRAVPFATGLKLANPELKVVVFSGDGDIFGIGGNHFIHALRRNPDITVVVHNNEFYALTLGQASPTTSMGAKRSLQPKGVEIAPLNMLAIAITQNCTFVASESLLRREIKNRQRPEITAKKRTSGVVTEIYVRPKIVW